MAISADEPALGPRGVMASPAPIGAERFWNLPNTITVLRIGVVPALLALPLAAGKAGSQVIAWAFIVAAVIDVIDGWLARRGQQVTHIGKLLDPLADKLIVATALIVLLAMGRIPAWAAWMVVVIVGRELCRDRPAGHRVGRGHVMAPLAGQGKTLSQNVAIGALIFHYETLGLPAHAIGMTLLAASTALTLWSGYLYFEAYFRGRSGSGLAGGSQP
jgi:CDP-diacylglycerol--glycerol-3-phosphate 3-phosphatidyltransferase